MASYSEDAAWVSQQYQYLFARGPTAFELNHVTTALQTGRYTRARWAQEAEALEAEEAVRRIYIEIVGKEPQQAGVDYYAARLRSGAITREQMRNEMAQVTLTNRQNQGTLGNGTTEDKTMANEDARAVINQMLDDLDMPELKDWAWQQIQSGHSALRIEQELRNTDAYKSRYAGLVQRRQLGLAPMTEREWLQYEDDIRSISRQNGLPVGFYDDRQDFVTLGVADISPLEYTERIEQGWVKVTQADQKVRDAFGSIFGVHGDAALASYFLDKDKALPLLHNMVSSAEIEAIGQGFGFDLAATPYAGLPTGLGAAGVAGRLAVYGISAGQAREGLGRLAELRPVFSETIGERRDTDLIAELQGVDSIFGLGDSSAIRRRLRERSAATGGGGGSIITSRGVGIGAAE